PSWPSLLSLPDALPIWVHDLLRQFGQQRFGAVQLAVQHRMGGQLVGGVLGHGGVAAAVQLLPQSQRARLPALAVGFIGLREKDLDRKSTRLNSSHVSIS